MHYVPGPFLKKQHRNSLEKGRGYPLSFSYIRMTYRATLRTENGGTTGYNSYKDRSFFCEACGLHYGKEKNYDFIYIVSVAVNHFIRNRILDYRGNFKGLCVAADPVAHRPHPVGRGSDLLLYNHFNTGRDRNYQGRDPDDIAGVKK